MRFQINHFKQSYVNKWIVIIKKLFIPKQLFVIIVKLIEINSKCSLLKALSYEEFDRFKHTELTTKNPGINEINDRIVSYISEHDKKYDYYLIKYDFKLVFNNYEDSPHIKSTLFNSKIMFSWKSSLEDVINEYINKGYTLNRIDELNIITIADKMDMSYDFYIKHNMHAVEWKLISMINKDKTIINKLNRKWRHPIISMINKKKTIINKLNRKWRHPKFRKISHIPFNN